MTESTVAAATAVYMGYDHGNAYNKVRSNKYQTAYPSAMVRKKDWGRESTTDKTPWQELELQNDGAGAETYIWAPETILFKTAQRNLMRTGKEHNRYGEPEFRLMSAFFIALNLPKKGSDFHVKLITGVPTKEKGTKSSPSPQEQQLKAVLENGGRSWNVKIDGREVSFTVEVVAILAQPRGSQYNHLYNLDGTDKDLGWLDSQSLILDIGGGTFCLDALDGTSVSFKYSDYMGLNTSLERIAKQVNELNPELNASKESVEQQIREPKPGHEKEYYISKNLLLEGFDKIVQTEMQQLAKDITSNVIQNNKEFNYKHYNDIFVVGGGGERLTTYIQEIWPNAKQDKDMQFSNVDGYFKRLMNLKANGKA